jgi:hypothetical protein
MEMQIWRIVRKGLLKNDNFCPIAISRKKNCLGWIGVWINLIRERMIVCEGKEPWTTN